MPKFTVKITERPLGAAPTLASCAPPARALANSVPGPALANSVPGPALANSVPGPALANSDAPSSRAVLAVAGAA